jgi:hypothetical protein
MVFDRKCHKRPPRTCPAHGGTSRCRPKPSDGQGNTHKQPQTSCLHSARKPLCEATTAGSRKPCHVLVMKGFPVRIRASAYPEAGSCTRIQTGSARRCRVPWFSTIRSTFWSFCLARAEAKGSEPRAFDQIEAKPPSRWSNAVEVRTNPAVKTQWAPASRLVATHCAVGGFRAWAERLDAGLVPSPLGAFV